MERNAMLDQVLDRYATCYDIERHDNEGDALVASAVYHEHTTGFALIRKAEMWSADRHEYAYFFSVPTLTPEIYDACYERAVAMGEKLVDPQSGHMCSVIMIIFLCDSVNGEAKLKVRKCRFRKSFQFGFKGWMEVRTCAVDLEESAVCANPEAHDTKRFMENILNPKKKKKKLNLIRLLFNRE